MNRTNTDIKSIRRPQAATQVGSLASGAESGPAKIRLRITRRGRVVIVASLLAVFGPLAGIGSNAVASESGSAPVEVVVHTVEPGDTLWRLARTLTPYGGDVRDTVRELQKLNGLGTTELRVGETVLLPTE